ncbi:hypothetical protein [Phenylobacterium sp.]|uniref:hypothetical protein n=1 Tax=Phenylobacterium sp. TaxID=1871053 RepID=UPI00271EAA3B|nr:hypothetical protein [Phenylobacterium sp.]MDO8800077.1 hypothetical protein [Phenylobacterium sp.]
MLPSSHPTASASHRSGVAVILAKALEAFPAGREFGSFTIKLLLSFGGSGAPEIAVDRVAEVDAEVRVKGVLQGVANAVIADEALKVALVGPEPEGELGDRQTPVIVEVVLDVGGDPLATPGNLAVLVIGPGHRYPHSEHSQGGRLEARKRWEDGTDGGIETH